MEGLEPPLRLEQVPKTCAAAVTPHELCKVVRTVGIEPTYSGYTFNDRLEGGCDTSPFKVVVAEGFEPSILAAFDFKSNMYTYSITPPYSYKLR